MCVCVNKARIQVKPEVSSLETVFLSSYSIRVVNMPSVCVFDPLGTVTLEHRKEPADSPRAQDNTLISHWSLVHYADTHIEKVAV